MLPDLLGLHACGARFQLPDPLHYLRQLLIDPPNRLLQTLMLLATAPCRLALLTALTGVSTRVFPLASHEHHVERVALFGTVVDPLQKADLID